MSNDFNWHGGEDDTAIILNYQPPTAVYSTKAGQIIVRQKADETEEYDPQLFLTPQGALAVAWALIEEAHLVGLPSPSLSLMGEDDSWPPPNVRHKKDRDEHPRAQSAGAKDGPESEPGPLLRAMAGEAAE